MVDLRLLGSTELKHPAGTKIPSVLTRPKRLALLTYLALENSGALHRREKLVGLFWKDSDETKARGSLSVAVHHLRRLLGEDVVVKRGREEVGICPDALRVDVHEFERAARNGELERAAELYRGPLLDGFHLEGAGEFSRWLENQRHRLHVQCLEVLTRLARAELGRDLIGARRWARRAAALAPYDEKAHRLLMEILVRSGHAAEALRTYSVFRTRLAQELEMEPSSDLCAYVARLKQSGGRSPEPSLDDPGTASDEEVGRERLDVTPAAPHFTPASRVSPGWRIPSLAITAGLVALSALILGVGPSVLELLERSDGVADEPISIGTTHSAVESIAVLPLSPGVGASDDEAWLSEGLTHALTARLARMSALHVISGASAAAYRGAKEPLDLIAGDLGVERLITGSVRKVGDSIRIDLRLSDHRSRELWAKSYQGLLRNVFVLQADAVRDLVGQIQPELTTLEGQRLAASFGDVDAEVSRLVLRGNLHSGRLDERALRQALNMYLQARTLDQDYAPAYAGIASAYVSLGSWHASASPREVLPLARAAVERALALDPGLATAHMVLGNIRFWFEWDWAGAERSFRRAIELNPSLPSARIAYAHFLSSRGRADEALVHGLQAVELDPLMPTAYFEAGVAADLAGRPREAMRLYGRGLELDPASDQGPTVVAHFHHIRAGSPEEAIAYLERAQELAENAFTLGLLGYAYGVTGRESEAWEALTRLETLRAESHVSPVSLAYVHLGLGNQEEALDWLETAFAERDMALVWLEHGGIYGPIRDEPRFQRLLEQMGFPE